MWQPPAGLAAILFDKDGTLVDYERSWGKVNRRAACIAAGGDTELERRLLEACGTNWETGRTTPDSLFASANADEIARHMIALGSDFDAVDLAARLDALFVEGAINAVPVTDLHTLFAELCSRGFAIGIASSDNEAAIRATARVLGVTDLVDFIAGYDSGHGIKPEPGMVLAFCERIGCHPGQVLMVGDNRHDLEMGRAAGAGGVVGVLTGTGTAETLGPIADRLIGSVSEMPALLHGCRLRHLPVDEPRG